MGASNSKPSNEDPKEQIKEKLAIHRDKQQKEVRNAQRTQHDTGKKMLDKAGRAAQLEGQGPNPLNVATDAEQKEMNARLRNTNKETKKKMESNMETFEIGDDPAEKQRKEEEKRKEMEDAVIKTMDGGRRRKRTRRRKKKSKKKKNKKSKKRRKRKRKRTKKKRRRRKSRK